MKVSCYNIEKIAIRNTLGQIIYEKEHPFNNENDNILNLNSLGISRGIYFVDVYTRLTTKTQKIVFED